MRPPPTPPASTGYPVPASPAPGSLNKPIYTRWPQRSNKLGEPLATLREVDQHGLERTIRRIPGVEAARVVMNGQGPVEIHVLASPGKPAKQIVRDVQSVALAGFGMQLDRRIVSVVQIADGELSAGDRPVVEDITEHIDGSHMTITVKLTWHGAVLVGAANGPASSTTRLRLVAEATLLALEQALDKEASFAVAAVGTPMVGSESVAVARVLIVSNGKERHLVGSALVFADPSQAMARAVLDALNRQVPGLRRS